MQGLRRAAVESSGGGPQDHPVVGHQPEALGKRSQREVALAVAGRPLDQHAAPETAPEACDKARMDDPVAADAQGLASGRMIRKRAPATEPSSVMRLLACKVAP